MQLYILIPLFLTLFLEEGGGVVKISETVELEKSQEKKLICIAGISLNVTRPLIGGF